MPFWIAKPQDRRLHPFVESVCFSAGDFDPAIESPIRVLPDPMTDLLVSVQDVPASLGERPATVQLFGTKTLPLWVHDTTPVQNIAFRFRPGAAARLFGVSAAALTDAGLELRDVLGPRARDLVGRVGAASNLAERQKIVEGFLMSTASAPSTNDVQSALAEHAAREIAASGGRIGVVALAIRLGVGERRLERAFVSRVGVGPKMFSRVVRFQSALRRLPLGQSAVGVALDCGYFDQAHMIRDFRRFAGTTPSHFAG